MVEVGLVAVFAGGGFLAEVGEVEGGAVFPLAGELFGEEVLGFAAAAGAPEEEPEEEDEFVSVLISHGGFLE